MPRNHRGESTPNPSRIGAIFGSVDAGVPPRMTSNASEYKLGTNSVSKPATFSSSSDCGSATATIPIYSGEEIRERLKKVLNEKLPLLRSTN